jgi:hypothetical protein
VVGLLATPAVAAETPSPTPSPASTDGLPASPSPTPSVGGSATAAPVVDPDDIAAPEGQQDDVQGLPNQIGTQLGIGIDRFIPYRNTATAVGTSGLASTTLPLPKGLVPGVLTGTLVSIADSPGQVRVRVGTNWVFLDAERGGDFRIPIPVDAPQDGQLTVEVRNTLDDGDGICEADFTTTETIQDLVIGFIGRETPPDTIAGFFSPPVQKVTVVIPDSVDEAIAEAALATVGSVARRYDSNVPVVVLTASQAAASADLLDDSEGPNRIVRIEPTNDPQVDVSVSNPGVPTLTLRGAPDGLAVAGAGLSSAGLALAAVPGAQDLEQQPLDPGASTLTFADLGSERPTVSGLGRLTTNVNVPQDRFGGPAGAFTIHVEGTHTPFSRGGQATVSLLWNDQLVDSQEIIDGDQYVADVTVSGPLVRRANSLTIAVDASPAGGDCSLANQPFRLDVNGFASTVTATAGQTLPSGFTRFPQSFGQDLHVAFGSRGATAPDLLNASLLVIALQRASNRQLPIVLQSFEEFLDGPSPGLVVGATPEDAQRLEAPLRFEAFRAVTLGGGDFAVKVDGPFAALEALETNGRNIVLLGSTAPVDISAPLMAQLADTVVNGEFGWNGLRDDLLVAQSGTEPVFLATTSLVPQVSVQNEARSIPWWAFAIGAALIVILLLRLWTVRRRRRAVEKMAVDEQPA